MYYYSTTFSGGPGVSGIPYLSSFSALTALLLFSSPFLSVDCIHVLRTIVAVLTSPTQNALLIEGRQTG